MNGHAVVRRARVVAGAALATVVVSCGSEGDGITVEDQPCTPVDLTYPGSANGTIASNGCVSGGFRAALYRFTANPNNAHVFTVTSAFPGLGVEVMSDPPGTNVLWVSSSSGVSADWLLPPGSFFLRVTARNGTGNYAVTGSNGPLDTPDCTIRTLVVGVVLADHAIATTDCPWEDAGGTPDGTYFDAYAIQSNKPCTIRMESATMDSFLELRNSTQANVVGGNDDDPAGGTLNSFVSLAGCNNSGGPLVIRANTATSTPATGNYTLTVTITGGGSIVAGSSVATPMEFTDAPLSSFSASAAALSKAKLVKQRR